jgi:RES domain
VAHDRGGPVPPPKDLGKRSLLLSHLPLERRWWRIHRATLAPCHFSVSPGGRFSSPGLGVISLAAERITAFWEVYWDDLGTRPPSERRIARTRLTERVICSAVLKRSVAVFDATSAPRLKDVSAPASTFSGDYENCQSWARALFDHPSKPDGLLYPSARHKGGVCLALFASRAACSHFEFGPGKGLADSMTIMRRIERDHVRLLGDDDAEPG